MNQENHKTTFDKTLYVDKLLLLAHDMLSIQKGQYKLWLFHHTTIFTKSMWPKSAWPCHAI